MPPSKSIFLSMLSQDAPSSPDSFRTAPRSPMSIHEDSDSVAPVKPSPYRSARQLPDEIRQHCHIYFDEQCYSSALVLLEGLVTLGAAHPDSTSKPAFAPLPFHIELVSALLIHPRHTNQAPLDETMDTASRSITILRNVLAILGPLNANLAEAFSFNRAIGSRTTRCHRNNTDADDRSSGSDEEKQERIKGVIANKGRIRRCARDFWHMVGWAFNCSVRYPKRWKYWKVWLDYMLDVLHDDWKERARQDEERAANPQLQLDQDASMEHTLLEGSLLIKYLSDVKGKSSALRRVVRSAFADGRCESLKEFPEVFKDETREVSKGQKRKREDTPGRTFGDFDEDEEPAFEYSDLKDQRSSSQAQEEEDEDVIDPWLGGPETMRLRQRVVALISRASDAIPGAFAHIRDVYDCFYTCVRPLPLPAFSLFLSPAPSSMLPTVVFVSLTQLILGRLLPSSAPRPQSITQRNSDDLSQDILEKCFLPFAATSSSIQDNAKVSIIAEYQFRLFSSLVTCEHTWSLDAAIEKGILARQKKVKIDKRGRGHVSMSKQDKDDLVWLRSSEGRLRALRSWVVEQNDGL